MKKIPSSVVGPCILLMVVLVSQVTTSRDNEKVSMLQPEFGPAPNLTKVQVDSTAFLHCSVINLQEDNQVVLVEVKHLPDVLYRQVSWIRRRDWHIMSVGDTVYTTDDRVLVNHREDSTDWILQFKFVRERDEGIYECQVDHIVKCQVCCNVVSGIHG